MQLYMAPLEGITGYIFRNTYSEIYKGVDKYFTPFIVPAKKRDLRTREKKDILPENNTNLNVVPQILTNKSDEFTSLAKRLKEYGYSEINLNAGCPSGTVVAKDKGAGILRDRDELRRFLDEIFSCDINISVKTRIGMSDREEFYEIMDIYNEYPMTELIIHPRVREDYYKNNVDMEAFSYGYEHGKMPVVYNGDIFNKQQFENICKDYNSIKGIMMGRGILKTPGITEWIKGETETGSIDFKRMRRFHDLLLSGYSEDMKSEINAMFKMKELWTYMIECFEGTEQESVEKIYKKIRKTRDYREYMSYVAQLFDNYSG